MAPTHSRKAKAATHVTDTVSAPTKTAESIASKAIKAIGAEINKSNAAYVHLRPEKESSKTKTSKASKSKVQVKVSTAKAKQAARVQRLKNGAKDSPLSAAERKKNHHHKEQEKLPVIMIHLDADTHAPGYTNKAVFDVELCKRCKGPLYPEGGLLAQRRVHAGDAIRYRQSDFLRGGYTGNIQEIKKKKNYKERTLHRFTYIHLMCLEKVDCEHMIKLQYKFDKDQFTDTEVETFTEFIQTSAEGDTDTIEKLMPGVAAASVVE